MNKLSCVAYEFTIYDVLVKITQQLECSWKLIRPDDLREHVTTDGVECWCEPLVDGEHILHNSLDEREKFETGERRPS